MTAALESAQVKIDRLPIRLENDTRRVITLPFFVSSGGRVQSLFDRIGALDPSQVKRELQHTFDAYGNRHRNIEATFEEHYRIAADIIKFDATWSRPRRLLAGAYLTMEYAIEAAALFNPSIVRHPDQSGVAEGELRFLLSLRATGEGHVSSIVFRTGRLTADGAVVVDSQPRFASKARVAPDRRFLRSMIERKLAEMEITSPAVRAVLDRLPPRFKLGQYEQAVHASHDRIAQQPAGQQSVDTMSWIVRSNYHIEIDQQSDIAEHVIYPMIDDEAGGIEDLRLVQFTEDDGSTRYYGTYTAYNGHRTLPMLIETEDFRRIDVHSLNGRCAINKGMALFPRRIGGHYVMCSRIDGENLYIAYSDYVHFWEDATLLTRPTEPWELMQLGNCGSPVETDEGWLLITHGVGTMRGYVLGAMLLDRDDPTRILGRLHTPLLVPQDDEREGYVPNVVYSCGSMVHNGRLFLPFAQADRTSSFARIDLGQLLETLLDSGKRTG